MRNYWWALIVSAAAFFGSWYLVYFLSGSTYLAYFVANIMGSFFFAFVNLNADERLHFLHSQAFHTMFSTSLVYFFGISLIFIVAGLI